MLPMSGESSPGTKEFFNPLFIQPFLVLEARHLASQHTEITIGGGGGGGGGGIMLL